jgi:hypothetical protein
VTGGYGPANPEGIKANAAAIVSRRRLVRQREVAQFYVRRLLRNQLVPVGQQGTGAPATESFEKVVLQKDHLNVVGDHGTQSPGFVEVEVTRDADGGMRIWSEPEVHILCKNTTGSVIAAGTPVYATGSVGATSTIEVAPADASNSAKMPAIGIVEDSLDVNAFGRVAVIGVVNQLNTAAYTINQTLFVAPGGGLTSTRPTATTDLVQNIARVIRVQASTGEILVYGAGRTNDVPNYGQGKLLGRGSASGSGAAQEITLSTGLTLSGTTLSTYSITSGTAAPTGGSDGDIYLQYI